MTLSQCPPYLTSYVWPASDHPRDARLSTSAKKRLHTPTNLRSHKPISHQISCHTKVSHTQENASKSRCHTNKSASNAAHRGTVPTSAIDGKVPFEEQHACGLQSLDGPSNVDGSFYKTRQWGHQAPTMCWGGLAHPISSCTSTTAGSYAQPSVPFSTSV